MRKDGVEYRDRCRHRCSAADSWQRKSQRPLGPPGPEILFKFLDANHDGVISEDEIPRDTPEPLKALLKAADKKGDKKVTLEEFMAAVKEHPPAMPPSECPVECQCLERAAGCRCPECPAE